MKKLLIALAILVVLSLGAGFYFIMNLSSLVARFQPDIEKQLSAQLGVPVALGKLDVSVFPRTEFSAKSFKVGEGLAIASLSAEVSLSELLHKKLAIESLIIDSPSVVIEKTAEGFGIRGLPMTGAKKDLEKKTEEPAKSPASGNKDNFSSPLSIQLSSFSIKNGKATIIGLPQVSPLEVGDMNISTALTVQNTSFVATNVKVDATPQGLSPVSIRIPSAGITGSKVQMAELLLTVLHQSGKGSAAIDIASKKGEGSFSFENFDLKSLAELQALVPALAKFNLRGSVKPTINFALAGEAPLALKGVVTLDSIGAALPKLTLEKLSGDLDISGSVGDLTAISKNLTLALNGKPLAIQVLAKVANESFDLTKATVQGFGGNIAASAKGDFALKNLNADLGVQELLVNELMKTFAPALPALSGKINSVTANLKTSRPDGDIPHRLVGPVTASLSDITVPKLQIIQPIIKALEAIPSLGALGMGGTNLSPQQTAALQAGETNFSSITVSAALDGAGNVVLQNLTGEAGIFTLHGQGQANVGGSLSLNAEAVLSDALSSLLISRSPGMRYAANNEGRIVVPVVITKNGDGLVAAPNVQKILQTAATRGAIEQGAKILNKALGGKLGGTLGNLFH